MKILFKNIKELIQAEKEFISFIAELNKVVVENNIIYFVIPFYGFIQAYFRNNQIEKYT